MLKYRWTLKTLCLVTQLYLTLYDPMDCSPQGSSALEDSPSKNTEVGRHAFHPGASQPRDWIQVSHITGAFFTVWVTRETLDDIMLSEINQSQKDKLCDSTYGRQIDRDRK